MRVLVLTAIYPSPERPAFGTFVRSQVEALRASGVEVDVQVLSGANRKLMYVRAPGLLRRRLRTNPVDLVHAHYGFVAMVARTQRRAPVVATYHGSDILGSVGPGGHQTRWGRVEVAANQATVGLMDAVIVQTPEMAARVRRRDVHVISHEIDFALFTPTDAASARRQLGLDPGGRYVLFAADPGIAVKNFPLARRAVELLTESDGRTELLVVHRETQERLALYMSAADVLAFASWCEGSPNVVKQAMACGLPIVATDVGDVREVIGGTDGCHVVAGEVAEFAAALAGELDRGRRTDGRAAVARFTPERVTTRLRSVYEEVLERSGTGGPR